ncbi:hypothetical protein CPB84DRAFT_1776380 [Gymnopilus junonius]|uniref:Uncharacterized protein n=1 Tax=Gymnopilus junonius TaxID=109634 RepID=A0A9P5TMZ8_GYMJU|nr:hypothetical protein CPB84DRAFT_1776380 [Gymnopilus junonius]
MPFSTDISWPAGLLSMFQLRSGELAPIQGRYNGPYNKILNYCFDTFDFFIAPEFPRNQTASSFHVNSLDPEISFIVFNAQYLPVLFVQIKPDGWASRPDLRLKADKEMREQYDSLTSTCPVPHLHGLSLLGTSLRVYCGDCFTREIEPTFEGRPSYYHALPFDFLEGAWNLNILSQEGFIKMKEIVEYIFARETLS